MVGSGCDLCRFVCLLALVPANGAWPIEDTCNCLDTTDLVVLSVLFADGLGGDQPGASNFRVCGLRLQATALEPTLVTYFCDPVSREMAGKFLAWWVSERAMPHVGVT